MTHAEIPVPIVEGALRCAADGDERYYLNAVYFNFPLGHVVATNGHALFVGGMEKSERPAVLIGRDVIEAVLADKPGLATPICIDTAAELIWTSNQRYKIKYTPLDGTFPNYVKLMAEIRLTTMPDQFDPKLLARAKRALGEGGVIFETSGPTSMGVMTSLCQDAVVVVMPWRQEVEGRRAATLRRWLGEAAPKYKDKPS